MAVNQQASLLRPAIEMLGRKFIDTLQNIGYSAALFAESLFWIVCGRWFQQKVQISAVFEEMMNIGVKAAPIVAILAFANGAMMAIQGIYTLEDFGAQSQIIPAVAMSVTREFGVLITSIVVAGRSGAAIAARIGTMNMAQEIDALRVMGIAPVRYLVSPVLLAMLVVMPLLTILADVMAILGGGVITGMELHIAMPVYIDRVLLALAPFDIAQGLIKSLVFGTLIALVATSNGFSATGGAEGLGKATTRSVVMCIAAIVIADMVFTFFLTL
jgi:phospholipid/cholesterol/gamma-HCH transport system permease protein